MAWHIQESTATEEKVVAPIRQWCVVSLFIVLFSVGTFYLHLATFQHPDRLVHHPLTILVGWAFWMAFCTFSVYLCQDKLKSQSRTW